MRIGDRVFMVDRYAKRLRCSCKPSEPSQFDGMRGVVTRLHPSVMVHLDGERLPMVFDERDFVLDEPSTVNLTGAE
jgi:hypothetical protein